MTWEREAAQNITYFDNGMEEEQEIDERIERVESTITDNENIHRFIIFKGTFGVPREVREAEATQGANRGKVLKRRISIAFPLDENKNLTSELPGKMRRGLYSFLPLEEANTGTKFLIQGDFIVQPGRDDMLWEAEWNKWIIRKVKEVAEQALKYFQQNPDREKWRSQYIPLFEFEKVESDVYYELIKPILRSGIENEINREELLIPCLCCGENISLDSAVKLEEETREFYENEFVTRQDLELIFEEDDMHFIGLDVDVGRRQVKDLGILKLNDRDVIQNKVESGDAIRFLNRLYSKLAEDHSYVTKYVVTEEDEIVKEDDDNLYRKSFPESVESLRQEGFEIDQVLTKYTFIKPELWERAEEYLDVDAVPYEDVSRQVVLPDLKTSATRLSCQDAVTYAKMVKDAELSVSDPIWVVTTDDEVVSSEAVLLGDEYGPQFEWEEFEQYLNQAFLSGRYLNIDDDIDGWKTLFQNTGMKGFSRDDYTAIAKDEVLPKVEPGNDIDIQELITYTRILRMSGVIGRKLGDQPILVVTKENDIQPSSDVFFGSRYSPSQRWDKQNLMDVNILSAEYLDHEDVASNKWKKFFKRTGVKETASQERIDNFGSELLRRELGERYEAIQPAGGSHDFEAVKEDETIYIELKSRSESEVKEQTLEPSQSKRAIDKRESYIFAYINSIPENPEIYLLSNPPEHSKAPQLVIPARALTREAKRFRPSDY